jgi:hypothetical protein
MKMTRTSLVLVTVLALSACLLAATASASAGRTFVEHTEALGLPEGWIKGDRLAADETVELLIAVRLANADELERRCVPSFLAKPTPGENHTPHLVFDLCHLRFSSSFFVLCSDRSLSRGDGSEANLCH